MVLGMEGLSHVDESTGLDILDTYYALGLRHASLTWNEANALATGVAQDPARGLTELGKEAVKRLNDLAEARLRAGPAPARTHRGHDGRRRQRRPGAAPGGHRRGHGHHRHAGDEGGRDHGVGRRQLR